MWPRWRNPWADERTSRAWIQGDLHAENFGTYLDGAGALIFDVHDFGEAYLGHFTWDLQRLVRDGSGVRRLDAAERAAVCVVFERYLDTILESKKFRGITYGVKDVVRCSGFGSGSAGLPAYNVLVEGYNQALDNDVVLLMKQGNVATPSRVVTDERIASHTLVPFQTEDVIAAVIGGREAEFVDGLTTFAREYAAVVRDDHRLFVDAFRNDEIPIVHSTQQG
jgi:uncharacterized protein (DUF2252 family)